MQSLELKAKGLFTFPSELSEVPDGALAVAKNVNIDKESVITPRRGFERDDHALSTNTDRINKLFEYQSEKILHYNASTLARDNGTTITDYTGSYSPPDSATPVRSVKANENFYFTTSSGLKKLDVISGTPVAAGAPKGLYIEGSTTGSSGFFTGSASGNAVAYRVVWGFTDENNNLILGAPSQRAVITTSNGAGTDRDISLTFGIPDDITTDWIYQVYRSPMTSDSSITPSDEMQLCYESTPTSGEITAGEITFTDSTTDDLLGATLYTSPSQETIANANEQPPFSKDVCEYKQHLFFSNTKSKHRLFLTVLAADGTAVSPSEAIKYDDVITINGVAYTGKSATDVASDEFKVFSSGTPAQNIQDTAIELCKVINKTTSNTGANAIYAYYVSGVNEVPGKILLESRTVGGAQFSVTFTPQVSGANPFSPELPTSGQAVASDNDEFKNAIYYSKQQQPESVPVKNVFRVGRADDPILRVLPLRDSVFILKENDGVYRLTGEDETSFRVDQFDSTANLRAPETAVVLSNAIYALTDQGVVQITETGVNVISRPIEDQIVGLFNYGLSVVSSYSYGIAYETERKYILATVSSATDTASDTYYVYNTFTRAWTKWDGLQTAAALVSQEDDKLYLADASSEYVLKERKTGEDFDFADYVGTTTISSISSLTLTLSNSDLISAGDVIYQSSSVFSIVDSVDTIAGTVTLKYDGGLTTGAATIYGAIDAQVRWVSVHGGNPSKSKHFSEVAFLFKRNFSLDATAEFKSDLSPALEEVALTGPTNGLFGFFVWGNEQWGGERGKAPERTWIPLEKQRCTQLDVGFKCSIGFSRFELNGLATHFREISERFAV